MQGTSFYRQARSYPPVLPSDEIVVHLPPTVQTATGGVLSWLQYLLPVAGMLGSMIFLFAFATTPFLIIASLSFGVISIVSGVLMGVIQRHTMHQQNKRMRESYLDYLSRLRQRLYVVSEEQLGVSERLYPTYLELAQRVEQRQYLWERRPFDQDFLTVRVGTGPGPLCCNLHLDQGGQNYLTQFMPDMLSHAEALIHEYLYIDDMPGTISLRDYAVLAINGKSERTLGLARALLAQLVSNHTPEDLRVVVYFPPEQAQHWEWLKWLPHARRLRQIKAEKRYAPEQLCMMACTPADLEALLTQQIKPELDRRQRLLAEAESGGQDEGTVAKVSLPHLCIVLDEYSPHNALGKLTELEALLNSETLPGVTILCLVGDRNQEPAQVRARLNLLETGGLDFMEIRYGGQRMEGLVADFVEASLCERIARSMASITLAETGAQQDISADIRLLDLLELNAPAADAFDPGMSWRHRDRADLLRVPLGLRADGRTLYLDLKEAADRGMGPHGLIVGATGSGKSELLRTLVIGLAVAHDPQVLNFVLIDFKGGASFADFAALPHVAGIITNLQGDLNLVDRVYSSLQGEQLRRQNMLHEAGNLDNIKQYQAVWQSHPEMEPMPHLVIIVDEFAELMASRPDFLDLFVTIGRVGRSLGIHLLFATQRLEEGRIKGLESHLRYRICLRTFSVSESRTMLGTSDAYYLPSMPGVGYFKVDSDIYDFFKTALISVLYVPFRDHISLASKLRFFTLDGKLRHMPAGSPEETNPSDLRTEMDVIIERLASAGREAHPARIHQVWLPPLPGVLLLGTLPQLCERPDLDGSHWDAEPPFGDLRVPVGLVDIPLQQTQEPLWLDFSGTGGHLALVGAPQSGKSNFLRTLVTSFIITHTPRDVQLYCIDMGGGSLHVFEQAPHVGAVCGKSERDKIRRLVRQMHKIIEDREFIFREHGIDTIATFREQRRQGLLSEEPFGDVFLIIDNFAQFYQDFDQLEPELIEIVTSGLTYGVHLVLATNRWAEVRTKLRDNIGTRLELRLNDIMESELGRGVASAIASGVPGRGANREKLQFQVALPLLPFSQEQQTQGVSVQEALSILVRRARAAWPGDPAPPIHVLPQLVRWEALPVMPPDRTPGLPIGLEEFRLSPLYIDLLSSLGPHFIVLGDTECGKTSLLRTMMRSIEQRYPPEKVGFAIIDFRKRLLDFVESKHLLIYGYNQETLLSVIGNIKVDLERRLQKVSDRPLKDLRRPQSFGGRHYFLFVDDYEMILNGGSGPLANLADYLLVGHDIGFHLILAHRVGGIGRTTYEAVFARLREVGTSAIIMSGDPTEGKILYGQPAQILPPGRGFFVQPRHPALLVQTSFAEPIYKDE